MNFPVIIPDSGFRILDSGFRIPDSGFRIPVFGFRLLRLPDYTTVKEKFETYFVVKKNIIYERAKFNSRVQEDNESVSEFIMHLLKLAEHCDFQALKDELIRNRIVVGIKDRRLSEKLQLDPKLTLEKATQRVKHSELVRSQQGIIHGNSEPIKIDQVVKTQNAPKRKQTVTRHSSVTQRHNKPQKHCSRCLGEPRSQKQCPARDAVCHDCKKKGHWSKACRNTRQVSEVKEEYDSDPYFMGEVTLIDSRNRIKGMDSQHTDS